MVLKTNYQQVPFSLPRSTGLSSDLWVSIMLRFSIDPGAPRRGALHQAGGDKKPPGSTQCSRAQVESFVFRLRRLMGASSILGEDRQAEGVGASQVRPQGLLKAETYFKEKRERAGGGGGYPSIQNPKLNEGA